MGRRYAVIIVLLTSILYVAAVLLFDVIVTVSPTAFDGAIRMCRTKEAQVTDCLCFACTPTSDLHYILFWRSALAG